MKTLRFYKEKKKWYADVPNWIGFKAQLQMVEGADKLLDYIAEGKTETTVTFSDEEIDNADSMILIKKCRFNGAYYKVNGYNGYHLGMKIWLCNVTRFVMGYFPETIYFKKVA